MGDANTERNDHLDNKNDSARINESEEDEGNQIFHQGQEMAKSSPMDHIDDIRNISERSEKVHITTRESNNRFPQQSQRMAEDFSMSHRDEETRIVQYDRSMSGKEEKRGETPSFNRTLKPARLLNQENPANENRQMVNYVRLTHKTSAGRGNVGINKNKEEQREHTEYVRLYTNQHENLPMNRGLHCERPPPAEVRQTGLPNQTPNDLIMFTPRVRTPREPFMQKPRIRFQTDLLGTVTPVRLGVKDPQLLPRNPPHPLLEKNIRLEEVQ